MSQFVAVHSGCGAPSSKPHAAACRQACLLAMEALRRGVSAIDAVAIAIQSLEDAPCTNAGRGSTLNELGQVECDAAIMDNKGLYGAVGALQQIANPIQVALALAKESRGVSSVGRVPPLLLVGEGAKRFAQQQGIAILEPDSLVTERSRARHERDLAIVRESEATHTHRTAAEGGGLSSARKRAKGDGHEHQQSTHELEEKVQKASSQDVSEDKDAEEGEEAEYLLDTVGAVCVDAQGNIACGASSGGIAMKRCGRVGQAAVFGAGCYCNEDAAGPRIACCTTGTGEYLIRTQLAAKLVTALQSTSLPPLFLHGCPIGLAVLLLLFATPKPRRLTAPSHTRHGDWSQRPWALLSRLP
eukprot:m.163465 g.163465  ORF g.163465 m.163465 type:complete len:358 (+) comp15214_c0_seq6:2128-3201(+)